MVVIQPEPFDPGALLARFCEDRNDVGGVVSFTGLARAVSDAGPVVALELEHYPGFTEDAIAAELAAVRADFALADGLVVHRVGAIAPGEAIVFVATAAAHRRAAFEGADRLMDWLKTKAPFWKRERLEGGARWIEPRPADYDDAARWESAAA